jgi:hypothetical protein
MSVVVWIPDILCLIRYVKPNSYCPEELSGED